MVKLLNSKKNVLVGCFRFNFLNADLFENKNKIESGKL